MREMFFLMAIAMLVLSSSVQCADQYSYSGFDTANQNSISSGTKPSFSKFSPSYGVGITLNTDASVVLSFIRSDGTSADFSNGAPSGYNAFGYYTMTSNGTLSKYGTIDLTNLADGTVNIGDFEAGDAIGFWAANGKGGIMDSLNSFLEKGQFRNSAYVESNSSHEVTATMGAIKSHGWGTEKLSQINDDRNFIFTMSTAPVGAAKPPMGQPMPPILTTMLVAGALLLGMLFLANRRKRIYVQTSIR